MNPSELTLVCSDAPQLSYPLSKFPDTVTRLVAEPDDPVGSAEPAQAVLAASAIRYNDEVFDRLPNLRILVRTGIGIDNVDLDAATRHRVVFCNTPDGPTESTAEHTVALMLAAAKQVKPGMEQLAAGSFAPRAVPMGTELMGKTLGLVGLGRVGGRVAHICGRGFDMRVLAFDPYITEERAKEIGVELADLDTVIGSADFLSLHAPSTPETRHLMNADRFAQMKTEAILLNLARGPLVDQEALLEALDSGQIRGAGLDVFDPEPPPVSSRLRTHPKIVATPHSATTTIEGRGRIEHMAVDAILDFFNDRQPKDICNPAVLEYAQFGSG
ncbi:MAG: hypothetical protein F4Y84_09905 [Caldilineaceae bacterium SB0665_bin_25]|nr:hypothetical protein [Caldilineaceae bacterium SB0665_bin_25]